MEQQKWVPHIIEQGARFHVISWHTQGQVCSCPNCVVNKPPDEPYDGPYYVLSAREQIRRRYWPYTNKPWPYLEDVIAQRDRLLRRGRK